MTATQLRFDETLLARMTGRLADGKTLDATCTAIGQAICETLQKSFRKATGISLQATFEGIEAGEKLDLVAGNADGTVYCTASIDGWSEDILLASDPALIIALVEKLLGGTGAAPSETRPLSDIELDVSAVLFEQVTSALRITVKGDKLTAFATGTPFCVMPEPTEEESARTDYAATVALAVELAGATATLRILMPQSVLIKTVIAAPVAEKAASPARPQWAEQLSQQVNTSGVELEAGVRLQSLTLDTASRLRPGDVLPFADEKDVRVLLKANGKPIYWCEFGKSGNRYMLRLQEHHGSEQDLIRQLTA